VDADNDLDLISGSPNYFTYGENNGLDFQLLQFNLQVNPFGLNTNPYNSLFSPSLFDIDNDTDLDLIVLQLPNDFYYFENKICDSVVTSITDNNGVLIADQVGLKYQWFSADDNPYNGVSFALPEIMLNDTNQSFIPSYTQSYFVQINTGGCVYNSDPFSFRTCEDITDDFYLTRISDQLNIFPYDGAYAEPQFQWIDCDINLPIEGEINSVFLPDNDGNFAVEITAGYCKDTTYCYNFIWCDTVLPEIMISYDTLSIGFVENAFYTWIDCDNVNDIENGDNYFFIPLQTGNYRAEINYGYCAYVTDCIYFDVCQGVSYDIINENNTLTAIQELNATYQWIECYATYTSAIIGETSQTFTPNISGSYAVEIEVNNCFVTSSCINITVSGINDHAAANQFSILPNPTEGKLNVIANKALQNSFVQIKSINGQVVFEQENISGNHFIFDITNNAPGVYFLEIIDNETTAQLKIIKE
jgi:Secretion system C-terminal sorting domain